MDNKENKSLEPLTTGNDPDIPYIDGTSDFNGAPKPSEGESSCGNNGVKKLPEDNESGSFSLFGKWSFPFLLSVSVVQLGIYLNKLYQDSSAVAVYYGDRDINYCIVSAACLFIPAIIYIVYVVSLYISQQNENEVDRREVGTKVVHGLLLVPWQIKGRVEVLHFSAQRVCMRRVLTPEEKLEKSTLQRQASVLEFFEEFYAGFLQLLLQIYIIILWLDKSANYKALPGEIVASALTLMAMMVAVKRKDDGILTGILSVIGWLSMMISRTVAIALATTVLHSAMVLVCLLHAILISFWISSLAVKSCQPSESTLSFKRKVALFLVIFTVFGLPSLVYWPIMFQLKDRNRPFIFLFIMFIENCLFFGIWYLMKKSDVIENHHAILIGLIIGGYVLGTLFICFYICCKPKYTDQIVFHDMKVQNAESFGMYFDFCDLTFKLPRTQSLEMKLDRVRKAENNPS